VHALPRKTKDKNQKKEETRRRRRRRKRRKRNKDSEKKQETRRRKKKQGERRKKKEETTRRRRKKQGEERRNKKRQQESRRRRRNNERKMERTSVQVRVSLRKGVALRNAVVWCSVERCWRPSSALLRVSACRCLPAIMWMLRRRFPSLTQEAHKASDERQWR
jgi:hypothetical protein